MPTALAYCFRHREVTLWVSEAPDRLTGKIQPIAVPVAQPCTACVAEAAAEGRRLLSW